MTDQELMEQFEDGTLPNEIFRHREHVRVAFLYLTSIRSLTPCRHFPTPCEGLPRSTENLSFTTRP